MVERAKWWHSPLKAGGCGHLTVIKCRVKAAIRILTHADLWCWLLYHGVIRSEINGKFTKFLLDLYKHKKSVSSEQKSNLNHKERDTSPQVIPRLEPVYRSRTPLMKRKPSPLEESSQYTAKKFILLILKIY